MEQGQTWGLKTPVEYTGNFDGRIQLATRGIVNGMKDGDMQVTWYTDDKRYITYAFYTPDGKFIRPLHDQDVDKIRGNPDLDCLIGCDTNPDGTCGCPNWVFARGNPIGCLCGGK